MIREHLSQDYVISLGNFEEDDIILGETYIFLPYLRRILERMEDISSLGVITIGQDAHTTARVPPYLQISFVDQFLPRPHIEEKGVIISPRSPMPPRLCGDSPRLREFLNQNKVIFEKPFGIYRRVSND